jgi:hypothetical protein
MLVDGAPTPWKLEYLLPSEKGCFKRLKGGGKRAIGMQQSGGVQGQRIVWNQLPVLGLPPIQIIILIVLIRPCAFWPGIIVFCLLHPMLRTNYFVS